MPELKPESIADFFRKKSPSLRCPVCAEDSWSYNDDSTPDSTIITDIPTSQDRSGALVAGNSTVPIVLIVCDNCGFIRLHSLMMLNKMISGG